MPEVNAEPYMIWTCVHGIQKLTRTQWGINMPPKCPLGCDEMDFSGNVPRGAMYVWNEMKDGTDGFRVCQASSMQTQLPKRPVTQNVPKHFQNARTDVLLSGMNTRRET